MNVGRLVGVLAVRLARVVVTMVVVVVVVVAVTMTVVVIVTMAVIVIVTMTVTMPVVVAMPMIVTTEDFEPRTDPPAPQLPTKRQSKQGSTAPSEGAVSMLAVELRGERYRDLQRVDPVAHRDRRERDAQDPQKHASSAIGFLQHAQCGDVGRRAEQKSDEDRAR